MFEFRYPTVDAVKRLASRPPDYVYRYFKCDGEKKNIRAFENGEVRFSKPSQFNDPFDCNIAINVDGISKLDAERHLRNTFAPGRDRETLISYYNEVSLSAFQHFIARVIRDAISNETGVSCFSEVHDSLLMWSHYAAGMKGFCVKYRVKQESVNNTGTRFLFAPVQYSSMMPSVHMMLLLKSGHPEIRQTALFNLLFTKSVEWMYEREWRLLFPECDKNLKCPFDVEEVYIGYKTDMDDKKRLSKIASRMNDVVAFEARPSDYRYGLDFLPVKPLEKCK